MAPDHIIGPRTSLNSVVSDQTSQTSYENVVPPVPVRISSDTNLVPGKLGDMRGLKVRQILCMIY